MLTTAAFFSTFLTLLQKYGAKHRTSYDSLPKLKKQPLPGQN